MTKPRPDKATLYRDPQGGWRRVNGLYGPELEEE